MSAQELSVHEFANQCGLALLYHGHLRRRPQCLGRRSTTWCHRRFLATWKRCRAHTGLSRSTNTAKHPTAWDLPLSPLTMGISACLMKRSASLRRCRFPCDERHAGATKSDLYGARTQAFEARFGGEALQRDPGRSFYRDTKDPRNSSIRVCEMLDAFLEDEAPIEGCQGSSLSKPETLSTPLIQLWQSLPCITMCCHLLVRMSNGVK